MNFVMVTMELEKNFNIAAWSCRHNPSRCHFQGKDCGDGESWEGVGTWNARQPTYNVLLTFVYFGWAWFENSAVRQSSNHFTTAYECIFFCVCVQKWMNNNNKKNLVLNILKNINITDF